MIVVPSGKFMMGSAETEKDHQNTESPQHEVMISKSFAVSKFAVTFAEYDACVDAGACDKPKPYDNGWGRADRPAIYVSWDDAQQYAAWLSRSTGKPYRLLSEAEWEYAARAGSPTAYPWGGGIVEGNANCAKCGSKWDGTQTAPSGSFKPNAFGLYDMHGNVYSWVEDCYNSYREKPEGLKVTGAAWTTGDCSSRVLRGGSWSVAPQYIRSADRVRYPSGVRGYDLGFRVARTLNP